MHLAMVSFVRGKRGGITQIPFGVSNSYTVYITNRTPTPNLKSGISIFSKAPTISFSRKTTLCED